MTGNYKQKFSAVLFALLMATSMMVGFVALTGTAAADYGTDGSLTAQDVADTHVLEADVVAGGAGNSDVAQIQVDYTNGGNFGSDGGSLSNVEASDVTVEIDTGSSGNGVDTEATVDNIELTNSDGTLTIDLAQTRTITADGADADVRVTIQDFQAPDRSNNPYSVLLGFDASLDSGGAGGYTADETNTDTYTAFESSTSGENPEITSVTKTGPTSLSVTFSEGVTDQGDGALTDTDGDLVYVDNNGQDNGGISGITHTAGSSTATVSTSGTVTASDVGVDSLYASTNVQDLDDNSAPQDEATIQPSALSGGGNGAVSYDIDSSATQNIVTGSADQELNLVRVKDQAGGEFSGILTLSMPDGVTINESASNLNTNTVTTLEGSVNIDGISVTNDAKDLELDLSGSSTAGEIIRIKSGALHVSTDGSAIDTSGSTTSLNVMVDHFSGTLNTDGDTSSNGLLTATHLDVDGANDGSTTVNINQNRQDLGTQLDLTSVDANEVGEDTELVLSIEGSGVTFNDQVDPSTLFTSLEIDGDSSKELDTDNASISGQTITVPVNDSIDSTSTISFNAEGTPQNNQGVEFNVTGTADSQLSLNASVESSAPSTGAYTVNSAGGSATVSNALSVNSPSVSLSTGQNIPVGKDLSQVGSNAENLVVDFSSAAVAGDTFINITTNNSAVSFATSQQSLAGISDLTQSQLDSLSDSSLADWEGSSQGDLESYDANDGDAWDPANDAIWLEGSTTANQYDSGDTLLAGTAPAAGTGSGSGGSDSNTNVIEDEWTTLYLYDDSTGGDWDGNADAIVQSYQVHQTDLTGGDNDDIQSVIASSDKIALQTDGDGTDNNVVNIPHDDLWVNTTTAPTDGTLVQFNATVGGVVSLAASDNQLTLERPILEFNRDDDNTPANATVDIDNDGRDDVQIGINTDNDAAFYIESDNTGGQIAANTWVNVTLEDGTGVTFDTRFSDNASSTTTGNADVVEVSGATANLDNDNVTITDKTLAIGVSGDFASGETIQVDEVFLNATSSATNTSLSLDTNTGDNVLTTDFAEIVVTNEVVPSNVYADADVSDGLTGGTKNAFGIEGEDEADIDVEVDSNVNSSVYVEDENNNLAFGGADVSLDLVSQPSDSDKIASELLNTTSVTTASDGTAGIQFTAPPNAVTGDYVVNASTSDGGVNITYTVTAGGAAQLNVTSVKDGIAGGNGDTGEAIYQVRVEDTAGNIVTDASISFSTIISGDATRSSGNQGGTFYENYTVSDGTVVNADGTAFTNPANSLVDYDATSDGGTQGEFFVSLSDSTEESVTLEVRPDSSDISGDTASAEFYTIRNVNVELNKSTTTTFASSPVGVTVMAGNGNSETVTVPRLSPTVNSGNTTVATITGSTTPSTNNSGVATTTATQQGTAGTASIEAVLNNKLGTAALTVEDPDYDLADVSLTPDTVDSNATAEHDLTYTVTGASDDGNSDTHTITLPNTTSIESASIDNITDANGEEISVSDSASLADANGGTNNQLVFGIQPDGFDTSEVNVDANVTVDFPEVSEDTTGDVRIDVDDSDNGNTNATTTVTIEAPAMANLSTTYDVDATTVTTGEEVTITATVENTGDASGSTDVTFYADGMELSNETVTVDAGNTSTATETTTFSEVGTHNVSVNDLDATNITVEEPAMANLSTTYTVDNTTVTTGEEVTITATVENTGDASGSTTVEFYADGSEISNTSVTVDAGNTSTATATATFDTAGTHNVTVNDLDATDITVENETTGLPEDPGFQDVLDVISAFNDGEQFNGVDVGFQDVLDVISAFNQG